MPVSFGGSLTTNFSGPAFHTQNLSAALTFAGTRQSRFSRALTAVLSFVGASTQGHLYLKQLTALLSFGFLTINQNLTASLGFAGNVNARRIHGAVLNAGLSFTGAMNRAIVRPLSAALTSAGVVITTKAAQIMLLVSHLLFTGTVASQVPFFSQVLTAGLSFAGQTKRRTAQRFTAALTLAGTFLSNTATVFTMVLTAALSPAGALGRRLARVLPAGLSLAGQTAHALSRAVAASLGLTGIMAKRLPLILHSASLNLGGSLTRGTARGLAGALSFTGSLSRRFARSLASTLTVAAQFSRGVAHGLAGALSFVGSVSTTVLQLFQQALSSALSFAGSVASNHFQLFRQALAGTVAFEGLVVSSIAGLVADLILTIASSIGSVLRRSSSSSTVPGGTVQIEEDQYLVTENDPTQGS